MCQFCPVFRLGLGAVRTIFIEGEDNPVPCWRRYVDIAVVFNAHIFQRLVHRHVAICRLVLHDIRRCPLFSVFAYIPGIINRPIVIIVILFVPITDIFVCIVILFVCISIFFTKFHENLKY